MVPELGKERDHVPEAQNEGRKADLNDCSAEKKNSKLAERQTRLY